MKKPSRRTSRIAAAAATPLAVVVAGSLVWQASYAAFSGQTRNSGNDWSTGSVALTDDDAGSARFQVANMTPGDTDTRCIAVTANASVAGTVKGYAVNPVLPEPDLAGALKMTVRAGTGGSFADCTGFTATDTIAADMPLSELATYDSYATGLGSWNVAPGTETRTYQVTWRFDTTGLTQTQIDQMQGDHAGIDFQWELQSS